jgi:hypothetical protein
VAAAKPRLVFGSEDQLEEALAESCASYVVDLSFVDRQNATDRHRNARKGRKTFRFSKDWQVHEAMTYLTLYGYKSAGACGRCGSRTKTGGGGSGRRL